jgi:glycogen synthase
MPPDDRLTVALVTPEYPPDAWGYGLATYTRSLAEGLVARGHRVHVVSRGRAETPATAMRNGVVVHRIWPSRPALPPHLSPAATTLLAMHGVPTEWWYRRQVARTLDRLVREHRVQVIESVDMAAEAALYDPAWHPTVPFVVRLHTPTSVGEIFDPNLPEAARRIVRSIERRHIRRATHVTGIAERSTRVILELMGIDREDVVSFPNPPSFDADAIEPGVADDGSTILFVGRINLWKGVHLLMQAVPIVMRTRPDARFILAGDAGYAAAAGVDMGAHFLGLVPPSDRHAVTFLGRIPHEALASHYRTAAVCTLPSLFDAFPYSCLEAMAFGRAIVASDHGGMAEMLHHGACGLLFTPPDAERLASHILDLLADAGLRRDLGRRAHERVRRVYGRDATLDRFEDFYRDAIADRAATARPVRPVRRAPAA